MRTKLVTMIVLFALLLSVVPAFAELELVDPFEDPAVLLDPEEAMQIQGLQSVVYPGIVTEVSPDDTTTFIANYRYSETGGAFLNIVDGSIVPMKPLIIPEDQDFLPIAATELVWFTNDLLGQVVYDLFSGTYLFLADRNTGEVTLIPVSTGEYFPISLAPNGSRMFAVRVTGLMDELKAQTIKSPFSVELPKLNTGIQVLENQRTGFYPQTSQKRRLAEPALELAVIDLTTGEATPLMTLPEDTLLWNYSWSQDGSRFAMIRDTVVYDEGFGYKRLVEAAVQDALGGISPEDNPFFVKNVIDIFDFSTGNLRPEAHRAVDGDGAIARNVVWSTDGQRYLVQMEQPSRLAGRPNPSYLFTESQFLRFYASDGTWLKDFAASETSSPSVTSAIFVGPDEVVITTPNGTTFKMFYYNLGSGEFRQVSQWDGTYYTVYTTRQSRQLIYGFTSFMNVPEIYRINWDGTAISRLTWGNAEVEKLSNVRADPVSFKLRSGAVREGWLIQPGDAPFPPKNVPIVFWQEGGPLSTMTQMWASNVENPFNLLPNFGVSILYVPLEGRFGFGAERLNALSEGSNFGQIDIDEGAEIAKQVADWGWATNNKIGVMGCSYGGYFTSQSITRHPNVYGAANTQCSLLNVSDEFHFGISALIAYLEGSTPMDNPNEYFKDAPLSNASKVRTPTLIFHGTYDFLYIKYAYDFHDQIEIQKYPVRMIEFDYEGHGLSAPTSQFRAAQEQILWFRKYLGEGMNVTQTEPVTVQPRTLERVPVIQWTPSAAPSVQKFILRPM